MSFDEIRSHQASDFLLESRWAINDESCPREEGRLIVSMNFVSVEYPKCFSCQAFMRRPPQSEEMFMNTLIRPTRSMKAFLYVMLAIVILIGILVVPITEPYRE
jgi:hypothetical protein